MSITDERQTKLPLCADGSLNLICDSPVFNNDYVMFSDYIKILSSYT